VAGEDTAHGGPPPFVSHERLKWVNKIETLSTQ